MIIGASLSEPNTSRTALQDGCVCLFVCGDMPDFKLNDFKFVHDCAKATVQPVGVKEVWSEDDSS